MKNIKILKDKLLVSKSEVLFGIDLQPENQCPNIDTAIGEISRSIKDIESYCKELKRINSVDEAIGISDDIDWTVRTLDTEKHFEQLRTACSQIRAWGEGWKDLAGELSDGAKIEDLIDSKFNLEEL